MALEDVDRAVGRHLDGASAEHAGTARRTAVAAVLRLAGAGEGRDRARDEIDDANAVVGDIGDEQPPLRRIEAPARSAPPSPLAPRDAVAAEPRRAAAGQGRDHARGAVDPADAVVMPVGDIDVARLVDRDAVGLVEASLRRRAAVAANSRLRPSRRKWRCSRCAHRPVRIRWLNVSEK